MWHDIYRATISPALFVIWGEIPGQFPAGKRIRVTGAEANDGRYTVTQARVVDSNTEIAVVPAPWQSNCEIGRLRLIRGRPSPGVVGGRSPYASPPGKGGRR